LRDAAAWCRRTLTNRTLLVVVVVLTLVVGTLHCLPSLPGSLKLTLCYWDVAQLPGRFVEGVLQTVAWWTARMVGELIR